MILKASLLIYNTTRPTCCSYVTRRDFSFVRMLPNPTGRTTENRSRSRLPASPASSAPPHSPDTASWNSSSLRALRRDGPFATDSSSTWCSVASVCSAVDRILFFSTSCSNFTLRT